MTTLAERLKQIREIHGLNCIEASELIGASHASWSNWESGRNRPSQPSIENVADTFGLRRDWLLSGVGDMTKEEEKKHLEEAEAKRRDEAVTVYSKEDEEALKDITLIIGFIKNMEVSKDRKRHIHKTLSMYRTQLESKVLFGEAR